jgi:hypothetical protein
MAMSPLRRTALYAAAGVFLICPWRVTMARKVSSSNAGMEMSEVTFSDCGVMSMRFWMGMPLAWRLTSGISCVRSRYTLPRLVKKSMSVWVCAIVEWRT